ncbi:MAG: ribosome maturation factor RimP [Campylobacterales bacterium]
MSLESEIAALVESAGAKLYDTELAREGTRTVFQIFVTREGGVDVELCARISRLLSPLFDVKPPVGGEYTLEVSSPGIERKLKTPEHFAGAVGENVKVTLKDKKRLKGKLAQADENGFQIEGGEGTVAYEAVAKAHVVFSWNQ